MVRNNEQNPSGVSERIKKRQRADSILLEMFSLSELPEQRISEEEQKVFGKRIARGEQAAKHEYILRRLRFAMMAAMEEEETQPESSSLTLEDHFQNIVEILQKKLDEYPMHADQDFAEYVGWSVRAAKREGGQTSSFIRIPNHIYEKWSKIEKFIARYKEENGKEPSDNEVALEVGLSQEQIAQLREDKKRKYFSNLPLEFAKNIEEADIQAQTYHKIKSENLLDAVQKLSYRERRVIELRFGLEETKSMSQEEVGQLFSVSHTTIGRIEKRALDKIKFLLASQDVASAWLD